MSNQNRKLEAIEKAKSLLRELLPVDDFGFLIAIFDIKGGNHLFHSTFCPRCAVEVLEDSLDANDIGHYSEDELDKTNEEETIN